MRISWDEYWQNIARLTKDRSTCEKLHVGALVVVRNKLVGTGYNGAPRGMPHCIDVGCAIHDDSCVRCSHAEDNAIRRAQHMLDHEWRRSPEIVLYCSHAPCLRCCNIILNSPIGRVVYTTPYEDRRSEVIGPEGFMNDREYQLGYLRSGRVQVDQLS